MITKEMFRKHVGRDPERDDLDRCNCLEAGTPGHSQCGWCEHDLPVFECADCLRKRLDELYPRKHNDG